MDNAEKIRKYTAEDYYALPEEEKVELINGVLYNIAPSPLRINQEISGELFAEIHSYIKK